MGSFTPAHRPLSSCEAWVPECWFSCCHIWLDCLPACGIPVPLSEIPCIGRGTLNPWTTRVHASLESHWLGLHSPRHTDPEGGRVVTNKYQTVSQFWDLALLLWLADLEHILFLLWLLVSSLYPWCCFFFFPLAPLPPFPPSLTAIRILLPQPEMEPVPLHWECKALTPGPPGKPLLGGFRCT